MGAIAGVELPAGSKSVASWRYCVHLLKGSYSVGVDWDMEVIKTPFGNPGGEPLSPWQR